MSPFYIASAVIVLFIYSVAGQNLCPADNGIDRECISLYNCESLLSLLHKKDRTQDDVDRLRKAQCGFDGNIPKVCCPKRCKTPEGNNGQCTNIYSCKHLSDMLKPPVPRENMAYIQNSKCQGGGQYSVCCGPPPNSISTVTTSPTQTETPTTGNCAATVSAFPPDPRTACCGHDSRFDNKIVGGEAASIDQYPWLVLVEYVRLGKLKLLCGGALISGKYVLTAAHCVAGAVLDHGTPKNIRLGEYDTSNEGEDCVVGEAGGIDCTEGITIIAIEKTIPHPQYNPNLRRNDIALIRMKQSAPWTDFIRPICLPTVDYTLSPPVNFSLYAAGWGAINTTHSKSNIKLHVNLPFENAQRCQAAYKTPGLNADLWNGQLCAGGEPDKDSCKGDSGGPLMYQNVKSFEVIGIVSFGPTPCGMQGIPGVYTKVYEYNDWIRNNIVA